LIIKTSWKIRIALLSFSYPCICFITVFIPGLNRFYLGDGLGWMFLSLSFPWIIMIFGIDWLRQKDPMNKKVHLAFGVKGILLYLILSCPSGLLADLVLSLFFGYGWNVTGVYLFWSTFPLSLLVAIIFR